MENKKKIRDTAPHAWIMIAEKERIISLTTYVYLLKKKRFYMVFTVYKRKF